MYAGHFAAGLALKAAAPRTPTWGIMIAVGLLDLVFGVLVIIGAEGAKKQSGLFIPWSHSLVDAVALAVLFGLCFYRMGHAVVAVIALAVLSHWGLDLLVHGPDMTLWPYAKERFGLGPVTGGNGGWFEIAFSIGAIAVYAFAARRSLEFGRRWPIACSVVALCLGLEIWRLSAA